MNNAGIVGVDVQDPDVFAAAAKVLLYMDLFHCHKLTEDEFGIAVHA